MFFRKVKVRQRVEVALKNGPSEIFTFKNLPDGKEHLALCFGNWKEQDAPLLRMHSECLTGDVFASSKCDCGPQLQEAISKMHMSGGIILYLRQEGRGIGLYNKLDAYALQAEGLDTYQANEALGFAQDLRKYDAAAAMLKALKKTNVRLLSNSPDKMAQLSKLGITIQEQTVTGVFTTPDNTRYLHAKIVKTGHKINLQPFPVKEFC